jgi:hypothetical protein
VSEQEKQEVELPKRTFCKDCGAWDVNSQRTGGRCRRKAPSPGNLNEFRQQAWPVTGPNDWCMESKKK